MSYTLFRKFKLTVFASALVIGGLTSLSAKDYSGAEIFRTEAVRYGKFEVRMLMAGVSGTVSSSFLYYNDSYKGNSEGKNEPWREIDIEILGKSPDQFQSNIITGKLTNKVTSEDHHVLSGLPSTQAYHTYAMLWTPEYVAWEIDGVEVRRSTDQQVIDLQDKDQNWRFNLWISDQEGWVGAFDPATLPQYQFINWTKYYRYDATNPANPFVLEWTENFDDSGLANWGLANWTFDQNLVDFSPDNVVVKDGYCILALTKAGEEGFNGSVIQDQETTPIVDITENQSRLFIQNKTLVLTNTQEDLSQLDFFNSKGEKVASIKPFNTDKVGAKSNYYFNLELLGSSQKYWVVGKNIDGFSFLKSSIIL